MRLIQILAALAAAVSASPVAQFSSTPPVPTTTPAATSTTVGAFCAIVTGLVTKAKAQSTATAFCSSYLSIKPVISTSIPTIVNPVVATTSVTGGVFTDRRSTVYVTVTIPPSRTVTVQPTGTCTTLPVTVKEKRAVVAKPACFSTYTAAPIISSACKCLSIPTPISVVKGAPVTIQSTSTLTVTYIPTVSPSETKFVPAPAATVTSDAFRLQAGGSDVTGELGSAASLFGGRSTGIIWRTQNGGQGFQLDPASCQLKLSAGGPAYADPLNPVIFADTPPLNYEPLICRVNTLTKQLMCNLDDGAPRVNYECQALFTPNVWHVNGGVEGGEISDCNAIVLNVV